MSHPNADVKKPSTLTEDLLNIFVKPSTVFENNRNASFVTPALVQSIIFLVLAIALKNLIGPFFDAEFARGMAQAAAKGQAMPPNAVAGAQKVAGITAMVIPVLSPWLVAIFGGLFTLIGARIVGAKLSFGQSATIASWSSFPAVLGYLTTAGFGAMLDSTAIKSMTQGQLGLGRFFDPDTTSPVLMGLLQNFDLFNLWTFVLVGIGVAVVARVSTSTGMVASIIKWGLAIILSLIPAAIRG